VAQLPETLLYRYRYTGVTILPSCPSLHITPLFRCVCREQSAISNQRKAESSCLKAEGSNKDSSRLDAGGGERVVYSHVVELHRRRTEDVKLEAVADRLSIAEYAEVLQADWDAVQAQRPGGAKLSFEHNVFIINYDIKYRMGHEEKDEG